MPRVSVIIPTYNRAELVAQAIDSALAQRDVDAEIIVVDDGSTDDTAAVLDRYGAGIRRFHTAHRSTAAARNLGLAQACGEYIAFLDSDDLWRADKLQRQVTVLDSQPDVGVACSRYTRIDVDGQSLPRTFLPLPVVPSGDVFPLLATGRAAVLLSTVLMRRTLLAPGEGFRTDMQYAEDSELLLRLARRTRFHAIQEPMASYRIHGGQTMQHARVDEMIAAHQVMMREHITPETLSPAQLRIALAERQVRWAAWSVRDGKVAQARRYVLRAVAVRPAVLLQLRWWGAALLAAAPWLLRQARIARAFANPILRPLAPAARSRPQEQSA